MSTTHKYNSRFKNSYKDNTLIRWFDSNKEFTPELLIELKNIPRVKPVNQPRSIKLKCLCSNIGYNDWLIAKFCELLPFDADVNIAFELYKKMLKEKNML